MVLRTSIWMPYICHINLCKFYLIFFHYFLWFDGIDFRLPWNQRTLIGWVAEVIFSLLAVLSFFIPNFAFVTFYIAIGELYSAFLSLFCVKMDKISHTKGDSQVKHLICELINFHILAKSLFDIAADFYSKFILIELICGMIHWSSSLFQIDMVWIHFS